MRYKLFNLVVGLAAVVTFSGQASAADGITGKPVTPATVVSLGNGSWSSYKAGAYTDAYAVSFASLSTFDVTVTADNGSKGISLANGNAFLPASTTSVTETLLDSAGKTVATFRSSTGVDTGVFSNLKGNYTLDVTTTLGATAARSGYGLTSSVTPVPEPTEGALLLSGLGLMGFIAGRRSRNKA